MSNVFKRFTEVVNKPNRAPYDLSFQNNLTMKFGKLYPVFCKEVLPGDSFKIQPTFNFNFMPLVSPVQTRMKATLHFFYVRNRPLWKDFMDWDGMTKEGLTPPFIKVTEQNRDMLNTGNIGDFFGIPSVVYGNVAQNSPASQFFDRWSESPNLNDGDLYYSIKFSDIDLLVPFANANFITGSSAIPNESQYAVIPSALIDTHDSVLTSSPRFELFIRNAVNLPYPVSVKFCIVSDTIQKILWVSEECIFKSNSPNLLQDFQFIIDNVDEIFANQNTLRVLCVPVTQNTSNLDITSGSFVAQFRSYGSNSLNVADVPLSELPWASDENPDGLRLNAFPFRAYEAIYNSFYRDERNNPRMVNGQPEYNKYITTDEGGADTTHYKLFQRNWEPDYLTTAVQSPQQGIAPLVGITSVSAAGTIEITDGNGVTYTAQTKLAEDGDTIQGIRVLSENSPTAVNRALVDLASTGISISDLRNVNALQRWLEINMRRGLRYRDQVKSHYGVDIEFKELQMPEFIGGVNEDVIVNRISQTVETEENPLGSLAGQAGVLGTSKHKISHYCDEKGFIIGIFSIAPVPNYSQNLPKHMIKTSQLDYFTPEFAHIGMQPILNSEVTPLQANLEGKLNDVFGYQRPWYEYLASTDEVHGQFRDSMRRYLINRVYDGTPELGSEFLTIDPETINDVFAVTEDTDKIYGQIWFDVTAKRPIASNVTPRIEP